MQTVNEEDEHSNSYCITTPEAIESVGGSPRPPAGPLAAADFGSAWQAAPCHGSSSVSAGATPRRTGAEDAAAYEVTKRAAAAAFRVGMQGRLEARPHQVEAVATLVSLIRTEGPARGLRAANYLLQHAAGSGKSLTIALLAHALLGPPAGSLDGAGATGLFGLVVILTDRTQLDQQLAAAVEPFLAALGRPVRRCATAADLAAALADDDGGGGGGGRVAVSTLQKLPRVAADAGLLRRLRRGGRVAIIADEAHRTHGGCASVAAHRLLGGRAAQPAGLTYVGFTATPSDRALRIFGCLRRRPVGEGDGDGDGDGDGAEWEYAPAHAYTMRAAVADGCALNPLRDYTAVRLRLAAVVPPAAPGCQAQRAPLSLAAVQRAVGAGGKVDAAAYARLVGAASCGAAAARRKARWIARHYRRTLEERACAAAGSGFRARAMVVCASRAAVLRCARLLRAAAGGDFSVYAAFSGELDGDGDGGGGDGDGGGDGGIGEDCPGRGGGVAGAGRGVTEAGANRGWCGLEEADVVCVCGKLETGCGPLCREGGSEGGREGGREGGTGLYRPVCLDMGEATPAPSARVPVSSLTSARPALPGFPRDGRAAVARVFGARAAGRRLSSASSASRRRQARARPSPAPDGRTVVVAARRTDSRRGVRGGA